MYLLSEFFYNIPLKKHLFIGAFLWSLLNLSEVNTEQTNGFIFPIVSCVPLSELWIGFRTKMRVTRNFLLNILLS